MLGESGMPMVRVRFVRFVGIAAVAGFCLLAGFAAPAQAATVSLFAAPSAAGTGDCSSAANACPIATAVTNANAASVADSVEIKLAGGLYQLTSPSPTALPVTFAGPSLTFEADGGTPTLSGENTPNVRVLSVDAASNVTIDGLEIVAAQTPGLGGGILNNGTLTVKNSTLSGNAAGNGGGISNSAGATLSVEDSTFSQNSTTGVGGGAIIALGPTTVERSAMINNSAPINGGAINVQSSGTLTLSSSTIAGNTSGSLGGALSNLGTTNVQASTIVDNAGSAGSALATGNTNATFAATIIGPQSTAAPACNPVNVAFTDGGYNLDTDGTCISPDSPATGSHNGTTAYESSTYAAVLDAYLADGPADNGGPTRTIALLNNPDPSTDLANPAFDVVPPSFDLPVAVDGQSKACSLSDQRGVVPAAGANCAIGAYLLQATKTEVVTSKPTAGQKPVTYTATVKPAPDGGTVSFDDGGGNPATSQCAAQSVSNGTATCTVSYPNLGVYPVTATYAGDGAMNNFARSPTSAPTTTTVVDKTRPTAPKKLKAQIRQETTLRLRWKRSTDNVAVKGYKVVHKGKKLGSTKKSVRKAAVHLTGPGGVYAVRAFDAAGNVSHRSKKVILRQADGSYRILRYSNPQPPG